MPRPLFVPCILFAFAAPSMRTVAQSHGPEWLLDRSLEVYEEDPDSAVHYANEVLRLVGSTADSLQASLAYKRIGLSYQVRNRNEEALEQFRRALGIELRHGEAKGVISTLQKLGVLLGEMGRLREGHDALDEALRRSEALKDEVSIARSCNGLAGICAELGMIKMAIAHTFRALEIRKRIGDEVGTLNSTFSLARLYAQLKQYDDALATHREHIRLQRLHRDPAGLANAFIGIAQPLYHLDSFELSLAYSDSALDILREVDNPKGRILARTNKAANLLAMDRVEEAEDEYRSLLRMIALEGTDEDRAETLFALASLLNGTDRSQEAETMLRQVIEWCQRSRNMLLELDASDELADCLRQQGRLSEALIHFERARDIQDSLFSKGTVQALANAEMREKYDAEARNLEIKELKAEIDLRAEKESRRTLERNVLIGMAIVLLAFAALLARNLQHRKNLMRQQQLVYEKDVNDIMQQQEIHALEAMLDGQDKERGRIAQDLHDGLGSMLSATKMQFEVLEPAVRTVGPGPGEAYDKVYAMLDDAVVEVRRISHDMARGAISRVGLAAALHDLRNTIQMPGKLDVELNLHGMEDRLEQHTELVLYRIVQELVSNVLKHSRASSLTIQVVRSEEGVNLIVEDDGVGFDPARVVGGIGLSGVRSRAAELGGRVEVDPQPGRGTTVMIDVPLAPSG
ncbi:MAG: sensor histidine kinase [Flavobacteriales bacterium]|nr:sensor histidine kinase [Flavobacteriales bacterium]